MTTVIALGIRVLFATAAALMIVSWAMTTATAGTGCYV